MSDATRSNTLDSSLDDRIEDACVRFEDVWRAGQRPALEQYLGDVSADGRAELLRELLKLDLYYRYRAGDQPTPDEYRPRFPDDADLVRQVFADAPTGPDAASDDSATDPTRLVATGAPRYVPQGLHARGGLGEVHRAHDVDLNRTVALKRVQDRWAGSGESRRRFLAEAEITGQLEHPGVVPVHGLVQDRDGEPCYAMRFIEGENFADAIRKFHGVASGGRQPPESTTTQGADAPRSPDFTALAFRNLLQRFVAVCNTVAYAHSRGIVHRDLKPANVMLGQYGETLVVDWGLAKSFGQDGIAPGSDATTPAPTPPLSPLAEETGATGGVGTRPGSVVGTPAYMSPEQARGERVDPAGDIFGLGAMLYALLTGRAPYTGSDALAKACVGEFPSSQSMGRGVPPALEAVSRKAMAIRPEDRYGSALELATDVERFLADEPVAAYRESLGPRVWRWARKRPRQVAAAAATLAVGLVAAGIVAWQQERARAAVQAKEAEAAAALDFVEKYVFAAGRPAGQEGGLGRDVKLIDAVHKALPFVETSFKGQPLIEARLRMTLASSFGHLADYDAAEVQSFEALRLRAAHLGPDHPDTLVSVVGLADSFLDRERHAEAIFFYEDVLPLLKVKRGPDHPDTLACTTSLAYSYDQRARYTEALKLRQDVLSIRRAKLGPDHPDTLIALHALAHSYRTSGRLPEAVAHYETALHLLQSKRGPDDATTLGAMHALAIVYRDVGRHDEALILARKVLAKREAVYGPNHRDTLGSMWSLAESLIHMKQGDEAVVLLEECLRRAGDNAKNGRAIGAALAVLQRYRADQGDAAACRAIAERWEKFGRTDPISLYNAACFRSIAAATAEKDRTMEAAEATQFAAAEADRAMAYLRQAVEAGMHNIAHMLKDRDLDALRRRDDYAVLLWDLADGVGPPNHELPLQ